MLILPSQADRAYRVLPWVPEAQWREPSLAQPKDQFWRPTTQTRFCARAMTHDGVCIWRGWFDSRWDADAFFEAILRYQLTGTPVPRSLYDLPTPHWDRDLADALYFVDTVVTLTTTGSLQSYTSPLDWNNSANLVEAIGGGGSGATYRASLSSASATGGGGGAYSATPNITFALPGTTSADYRVGTGGGAKSPSNAGEAGSDTWFNGASLAASSVGAKGGLGGIGSTSGASQTGPAGGDAGSGIGTTKTSGGKAGNAAFGSSSASGGGGAGGPHGDGNAGSNASANSTAGGAGDAGSGGSAGASGGGNAGSGVPPNYSGGGGGGYRASIGNTAGSGDGGNYGGASGGTTCSGVNATGGVGIQGIIVLTYTPVVPGGGIVYQPYSSMRHMIVR